MTEDPLILWREEPDVHDFPAAENYLTLLVGGRRARELRLKLEEGSISHFKAKDIMRASGLQVLPLDNEYVKRDVRKVVMGRKLSPVLLVGGERLIIADGYHRVCASYHLDENALIPCILV